MIVGDRSGRGGDVGFWLKRECYLPEWNGNGNGRNHFPFKLVHSLTVDVRPLNIACSLLDALVDIYNNKSLNTA